MSGRTRYFGLDRPTLTYESGTRPTQAQLDEWTREINAAEQATAVAWSEVRFGDRPAQERGLAHFGLTWDEVFE